MNEKIKRAIIIAGGIVTGVAVFKPVLNSLGYRNSKFVKDNPIQDITPIDTEEIVEEGHG